MRLHVKNPGCRAGEAWLAAAQSARKHESTLSCRSASGRTVILHGATRRIQGPLRMLSNAARLGRCDRRVIAVPLTLLLRVRIGAARLGRLRPPGKSAA